LPTTGTWTSARWTPAGVWNLKALELARRSALGERETVRLLAALNTAMADAFIACWREKFRHWSIRPVNAIRERFDPSFLPYLLTPAFPSYPSGHATVSGAAAEVLARALPMHASEARSAAEEAAMSRLYGGIHVESDNREGLWLGRRIGEIVAERYYGRGVAAGLAALAPVGAPGIEGNAQMASTNAAPQRCAAARLAMRPFETVAASRPTIRWDAVPGADRYHVQVTSRAPEGGNLQSTDAYVDSTKFQPPLPLTDATAIVYVSVQPVCSGEPGPTSRRTFFVDTRLACPAPQLAVEAQDGQLRVRWDRAGPAETVELRAFAGADASLRAQVTLGGPEGAVKLDRGAAVIVSARRKCEEGFSEFSFVRYPGQEPTR
jgi:hypothetical protein